MFTNIDWQFTIGFAAMVYGAYRALTHGDSPKSTWKGFVFWLCVALIGAIISGFFEGSGGGGCPIRDPRCD